MVRRASARVVVNREALNRVHLALVDGVEEVARTIVETANAPDQTPFGVGLVRNGGWAVYSDGKKVGGGGLDGTQPAKPRAFVAGPGISAVAGFGFPARFQEVGTVHQPARPFLTPAGLAVAGMAGSIMRDAIKARIR